MPTVIYKTHDGGQYEVEVPNGSNVMVGALDNMIDGILGECGGACACATCHVLVPAEWAARVPAIGPAENDLLECTAVPRTAQSRLSCQIQVSEALDGLTVNLPERQS